MAERERQRQSGHVLSNDEEDDAGLARALTRGDRLDSFGVAQPSNLIESPAKPAEQGRMDGWMRLRITNLLPISTRKTCADSSQTWLLPSDRKDSGGPGDRPSSPPLLPAAER